MKTEKTVQGSDQTTVIERHHPASTSDTALYEGERWYLTYTQPRHERSAQIQLNNQGFRTFLPLYEKTTRHARRLHRAVGPLFPRYMFVILNLDRDPWHSINGTFGVKGLVMARDRPLPVAQGVVEGFIAASSHQGEIAFRQDLIPGQEVRMVGGPFAEQLAVFQRLDDRGRVCVLLQMMGSAVPVRMPRADIVPLH